MSFACIFFLLKSPHRLSFVIDVFDFSVSLNDIIPASLMWLPIDVKRKVKKGCLMGAFCMPSVFFVFTPQMEFSE